jgi:hypothetical protein
MMIGGSCLPHASIDRVTIGAWFADAPLNACKWFGGAWVRYPEAYECSYLYFKKARNNTSYTGTTSIDSWPTQLVYNSQGIYQRQLLMICSLSVIRFGLINRSESDTYHLSIHWSSTGAVHTMKQCLYATVESSLDSLWVPLAVPEIHIVESLSRVAFQAS